MRCPGQDRAYWSGDGAFDIPCPRCGATMEFFKDEASRRCSACGYRYGNPRNALGCAQWCAYAEQCVGLTPGPASVIVGSQTTLASRLIRLLEEELGDEAPGIFRAMIAFQHAQALLAEEGGDIPAVLAAAVLRDLDPGDAARLLQRGGFDQQTVEQATALLQVSRSGQTAEGTAPHILDDALLLTQLTLQRAGDNPPSASPSLDRDWNTEAGRKRAQALFDIR